MTHLRASVFALTIALAASLPLTVEAASHGDSEKQVITPTERMPLWSGNDLSKWIFVVKDEGASTDTVWSIQDGVVRCAGEPWGFMRTRADYANYRLHLEWRWIGEPGNNGVLLHSHGPNASTDAQLFPTCIEAQLKHESAGDIVIMYGSRIAEIEREYPPNSPFLVQPKFHPTNEKPVGEWNTYAIVCKDDTIKMYVNGLLQNEATGASHRSGAIALQSEGGVIEFRNATLMPLESVTPTQE